LSGVFAPPQALEDYFGLENLRYVYATSE